LAERKRTWHEVLSTFVQAGRGLAAAHAAGIVDRGFKTAKVLVGKDGRVRGLDFGVAPPLAGNKTRPRAARAGGDGTEPGRFIGTPAYMAPEQLMGERVDEKTDQYSFCVALFQGLYGTLPFDAENFGTLFEQIRQHKVNKVPNLNSVPSSVHKALLRG